MRKATSILLYAWQDSRLRILFLLLVFGICGFAIYHFGFQNILENYTALLQLIDGVITLLLIVISIAIWYEQVSDNWEEQQTKLLTVYFCYEGKKILCCKNATLAGEADIRAWGQQLGTQMVNNSRLSFQPDIEIKKLDLKYWSKSEGGQNSYVVPYVATFKLNKKPQLLIDYNIACRIWEYPFVNDKGNNKFIDTYNKGGKMQPKQQQRKEQEIILARKIFAAIDFETSLTDDDLKKLK